MQTVSTPSGEKNLAVPEVGSTWWGLRHSNRRAARANIFTKNKRANIVYFFRNIFEPGFSVMISICSGASSLPGRLHFLRTAANDDRAVIFERLADNFGTRKRGSLTSGLAGCLLGDAFASRQQDRRCERVMLRLAHHIRCEIDRVSGVVGRDEDFARTGDRCPDVG